MDRILSMTILVLIAHRVVAVQIGCYEKYGKLPLDKELLGIE